MQFCFAFFAASEPTTKTHCSTRVSAALPSFVNINAKSGVTFTEVPHSELSNNPISHHPKSGQGRCTVHADHYRSHNQSHQPTTNQSQTREQAEIHT